MRLFGGDRVQGLMNTLGVEEDMPIENKMLSNTIESSQSKIEGRNFQIRKNVLQYDDVMNRQREIIYGQRKKVLDGEDVSNSISTMISDTIADTVSRYVADNEVKDDWNLDGLRDFFMGWLTTPADLRYTTEQLEKTTKEDITQMLTERALKIHKDKEAAFTSELMREIERMLLLRNVDSKWMDHIDSMEELKRGIGLRSIGQRDPIIEYRMEGFEMFEQMTESIKEDTVKQLLTVQLRRDEEVKREQVAKPTMAIGGDGSEAKRPVRAADKVGRNDLCPCGSGKKYKKCCGA